MRFNHSYHAAPADIWLPCPQGLPYWVTLTCDTWLSGLRQEAARMLNYLLLNFPGPWDVSEPVEHCELITCMHSGRCCRWAAPSDRKMRDITWDTRPWAVNESSWWEWGMSRGLGMPCSDAVLSLWTNVLSRCADVRLTSGGTNRLVWWVFIMPLTMPRQFHMKKCVPSNSASDLVPTHLFVSDFIQSRRIY